MTRLASARACNGTPRSLCLLFLLFQGSAFAAEPTRVALIDAVRIAEEHSPLVRRALRERGVVAAGRVGAGVLLPANPVLTVTAGHRRDHSSSSPSSHGPEVTGRLEQQIEIAGQRGTRLREADRAIDVADARLELARLETRARVRAAYLGALLARRHADYARDQEALGTRLLEIARARATAGAGNDVDRNLAEAESGRLAQEHARARLAVDGTLDRLRLAMGIPAREPIELASPLEPPPPVAETLEVLIDRARLRRAELHVLDAGRDQLDAAIARLRRERVPSPTLFFDVMSQQPGQLYLGGGIALPLPLWRRNQGELAAAHAARELIAEERSIADAELEVEVGAALRLARGLRESVARGQDVVVPAAERSAELISAGWTAGKFNLFRVVQASREVAEARRRQLELLGVLWDATITLERVTGGAR